MKILGLQSIMWHKNKNSLMSLIVNGYYEQKTSKLEDRLIEIIQFEEVR